MEWISAIQKAIDYIEEHILEEINYLDVAREVYISSYEFHRAFSFLTGMTANTYIRSRRLSLAAREIIESDAKITDIALKYGYETPESFTKAFTRFHGVAPKFAREPSTRLVLFNPLAVKISLEGGKSMDYRIAEGKAQKFIAIVNSFSNEIINDDNNHDIPDFWDECGEKGLISGLLDLRADGKRDLYGLCSPTKEGEDFFKYGIGVLVDSDTKEFDIEEMQGRGYSIWSVDPATYAVFDCIGDDGDCISETWARFYKEFLPQMGYEAANETDYEIYPQNGREGLFCELWVPIKKK